MNPDAGRSTFQGCSEHALPREDFVLADIDSHCKSPFVSIERVQTDRQTGKQEPL